jgi:hypothetical protein
MLHQVLAQLASFLTNLVNNNLIELGDDGAKLITTNIWKIVKYVARFFLIVWKITFLKGHILM